MPTINHSDGATFCQIKANSDEGHYTGILNYKTFEVGRISGVDPDSVMSQFQAICDLIDGQGAMVRRGVILLGYHNGAFRGEVLLVDGEVLGEWQSDEMEWCHFTPTDSDEVKFSAPSPWMLHDEIADRWDGEGDSDEGSIRRDSP